MPSWQKRWCLPDYHSHALKVFGDCNSSRLLNAACRKSLDQSGEMKLWEEEWVLEAAMESLFSFFLCLSSPLSSKTELEDRQALKHFHATVGDRGKMEMNHSIIHPMGKQNTKYIEVKLWAQWQHLRNFFITSDPIPSSSMDAHALTWVFLHRFQSMFVCWWLNVCRFISQWIQGTKTECSYHVAIFICFPTL